jgi:hypothetical protein
MAQIARPDSILLSPDISLELPMPSNAIIRLFALSVLAVPVVAQSQDLFVNGSRLTGMTGSGLEIRPVQDVIVDGSGNVHVIAPDFAVAAPDGAPLPIDPAAQEIVLNGDFYLVTDPVPTGTMPDRIEVQINGNIVRVIQPSEGQLTLRVSEYFRLGQNTVTFRATRTGTAQTDNDWRVMVGKGVPGEGVFRLSGTVAMTRSQASLDTESTEFLVTVGRDSVQVQRLSPNNTSDLP